MKADCKLGVQSDTRGVVEAILSIIQVTGDRAERTRFLAVLVKTALSRTIEIINI